MKKKIITIIIIFLAIAIVALFFIPWYDNYYYLPGVNSETGEEVITRFDEWQSPFYALVIKGGNSIFFGVLFFIVLLIPLISITYGGVVKNDKKLYRIKKVLMDKYKLQEITIKECEEKYPHYSLDGDKSPYLKYLKGIFVDISGKVNRHNDPFVMLVFAKDNKVLG